MYSTFSFFLTLQQHLLFAFSETIPESGGSYRYDLVLSEDDLGFEPRMSESRVQ